MDDIAIVGGGPVGSRLAYQLTGYGYRVAVFEAKEADNHGACCTGIVSQECRRTFAIPDDIVLRQPRQARLFSPSGKELLIGRETPQATVLDRAAFDRYLAQLAQESGADYHYASTVTGLETYPDKVELRINHRGKDYQHQARAVALEG